MIILTGVAGSGKSTQAKLLADRKGYPYLSTGAILRVLVTGKRRQEMLEGKLLSDDEMIRMLDTVMQLIDTTKQFVLDGFPRTHAQAEWVLAQVEQGRFNVDAVLHLVADRDDVRSRLLARGRADDTEASVQERFAEYEEVTEPMLNDFRQKGIAVHDIDAGLVPDDVAREIDVALGS